MQLQQAVNTVFVQLSESLVQISQQEYVQPCKTLFNNTIGQHVRHVIELFQCLEKGYEQGTVNYEKGSVIRILKPIRNWPVASCTKYMVALVNPIKNLPWRLPMMIMLLNPSLFKPIISGNSL